MREAGHDVSSVPGEGLVGIDDGALIEVCRQESRCLITMDLGFADPLHVRPADYAGIVVLRIPGAIRPAVLRSAMATLSAALESEEPDGQLWIVEPGRVRKYQPLDE